MAARILGGWFLVGQDDPDYPDTNFDCWEPNNRKLNDYVDVREDHGDLIRVMGAASTVLLKNVDNALPLKGPMRMAVFGSDAGPSYLGPNSYPDRGGFDGVLAIGWGSGTADFPYLISPLEALQRQAVEDHSQISWILDDYAYDNITQLADRQDLSIVFVASNSGEEFFDLSGNIGDRNNITAWKGGDDLVLTVANVTDNVIVVVHSVGPMVMEKWIDHPNVTAVVMAGLPGQEAGNSIVDVLYGRYNPSGRLPYTIPRKETDVAAEINFINTDLDAQPQADYTEGIYVDYRWHQKYNVEPRFGFGYGLSYTQFEYDNLKIKAIPVTDEAIRSFEDEGFTSADATNQVGSSLALALHHPRFEVTADISNVGDVEGAEIPQLYIGFPKGVDQAPKVLKGFEK